MKLLLLSLLILVACGKEKVTTTLIDGPQGPTIITTTPDVTPEEVHRCAMYITHGDNSYAECMRDTIYNKQVQE